MAPLIRQGVSDHLNETQNKIQILFEDHHEDEGTLTDYSIQKKSTLDLLLRLRVEMHNFGKHTDSSKDCYYRCRRNRFNCFFKRKNKEKRKEFLQISKDLFSQESDKEDRGIKLTLVFRHPS